MVGALPCVVVGLRFRDPRFDCVLSDDTVGTQLAVDHLVGLGHERIVHVDGGSGASSAPRRNGYLQAMRNAGLEGHVIAGEFDEHAGARAAQALLGRPRCRPRSSPPTTSSRSA